MNCDNLKMFYVTAVVTKNKISIKYTQRETRRESKHVTIKIF